jgi:hypothetical protein
MGRQRLPRSSSRMLSALRARVRSAAAQGSAPAAKFWAICATLRARL